MQPGTRLGPYEVVSLLGSGGMGEVYRASDNRLRRTVAVKVLPAIYARDPERVRRFSIEALAAAALNHPNILAVYDIGSEGGAPFVVSELLEGESLRERLTRGPLSAARVIDLGTQIAAGLAAAHAKGIVHRDLKPDNVFVTADGRIKVLDFGIAKLIEPLHGARATDDAPTKAVTEPGTVLGTLGYMSPEQIRGQATDQRSDLFSLGCLLYEMLSGRRAFAGATPADVVAAALTDDPPPLASLIAEVPPALARIVAHCLEKAPERRFQSASDLAFALGTAETPSTSVPPPDVGRSAAPTTYAVIPLPTGTRLAGFAAPAIAISRDGTKLAFVASTDRGRTRLFVTLLDRGDTVEIPDSEGAVGPSFSTDGSWIAFAVGPVGTRGTELRKYSFASRLTQSVCALADFEGASWADDGGLYFVPGAVEGLRRVAADAGIDEQVRRTFRVGANESPRCIGYPQIAPGGRVAIVIDWDASALGDTSLLDLSTGELKSLAGIGSGRLLPTGHVVSANTDGTLLATPVDRGSGRMLRPPVAVAKDVALDGSGGVFAVSDNGTLVFARGQLRGSVFEHKRLVRLAPDCEVDVLPFPPDSVTSSPRLSPDRHRLAVSSRIHGIWICDLQRGTRARLPPGATRLTKFPIWTPDGERIIFRGALVGEMGWKVLVQWADGRGEPEILIGADARERRPCGVTPDGRLLYAMAGAASERGLWVFPLDGHGEPERLFSGQIDDLVVSHDGRMIAYESAEFGAAEVFVRRLGDRGMGTQVSVGGGRSPRWSEDGEHLYYLTGSRLMGASIDATREVAIGPAQVVLEREDIEGYDVEGDSFVAAERPPGSGEIRQLQIVTNWFPRLLSLSPVPQHGGITRELS